MFNLGSAIGYLDLDHSEFSQGLKTSFTDLEKFQRDTMGIGDKLSSVGSNLTKVGTGLSLGLTVPIVGAGTAAVKFAADFETNMAKVKTVADTTAVPFDDIRQGIMDLSNETGKGTDELSEGLYQVISATGDTKNAMDYLEQSVKLAKGGFTDTASAVNSATGVLNAYGETGTEAFNKVTDTMVVAQNTGKTTVSELAGSLYNVVPVAASLSVGFDQVAASIAAITAQGTPTAQATTQMRQLLIELSKAGSAAADTFTKLAGKSFKDFIEQGGTVTEAIAIMEEAAKKDNKQLSDMFSSVEAGAAAMQLSGDGANKFNDSLEAMQDSAGATQKAFETMDDTMATRLEKVINSAKNMAVTFGELLMPVIEKVVGWVQKAVDWLDSLDESQKETIITIGAVLAVAGPAVLLIGQVISGIGGMVTAFTAFKAAAAAAQAAQEAMAASGAAMSLTNPVGWIALAIAGIVALCIAIDSVDFSKERLVNGIAETNSAMAIYRDSLGEANGAISDFSGWTNKAGDSVASLSSKIDETEGKITQIYSDAFAENRELRDGEIESIEGFNSEIDRLERERLNLINLQYQVQMNLRRSDLNDSDLTFTELRDIYAQGETALDTYVNNINTIYERDLANLENLHANKNISDEDYNIKYAALKDERKMLLDEAQADNTAFATDIQTKASEMLNVDISAFTQRNKVFTDSEQVNRYYAEQVKKIRADDTTNAWEKFWQEDEIGRLWMQDLSTVLNGNQVAWTDYGTMFGLEAQKQATTFMTMVTDTITNGDKLSTENKEVARKILNAYINLPEDMQEKGKESLLGLVDGLKDQPGMESLKNASNMTANEIVETIKANLEIESPSKIMYGIGGNVTDGLSNGMNGRIDNLLTIASNIAWSVINTIKSIFGIKSPSKVGGDIGDNFSLAMGNGILGNLGFVKGAGKAVAAAAMEGADELNVSAYDVAWQTGNKKKGDPNKQQEGGITNNIDVSITSPEALSELEMADEIKRVQRELALGV